MDFNNARLIGVTGSVLVLISTIVSLIFPVVGFFGIVGGIVLVLVSLYYFSKIYNEPSIFKNALIFGVIVIAEMILAMFIIVPLMVVFGLATLLTGGILAPVFGGLAFFIVGIILVLVVVAVYFWYKALTRLSKVSDEKLFALSAKLAVAAAALVIIGILTLIIVFIGFIVDCIGWILLAIAFYNMKPPQEKQTPPIVAPAVPA